MVVLQLVFLGEGRSHNLGKDSHQQVSVHRKRAHAAHEGIPSLLQLHSHGNDSCWKLCLKLIFPVVSPPFGEKDLISIMIVGPIKQIRRIGFISIRMHKIYLANWVSVSLSSRDANAGSNISWPSLLCTCLPSGRGWSMPHIEDSNIFEIYPSIFDCYSYIRICI